MKRIENSRYAPPKDYHSLADEPLVLHCIKNRSSDNLVILIHGLTGQRYEYWGKMPQYLMEDIPHADLGLYQFRTAWQRFGAIKSIDLASEAEVLADQLRRLRRYKSIAIIGHSMGGVLAKAAISSLIKRNFEHHLKKICCLVLLAAPQLGSLRVPGWAKWISRDGRALYPHNLLLQSIDTDFSTKLNLDRTQNPAGKFTIPTSAIVGAEDFWVDALSAGIGVPTAQKFTVRASHGTIKCPKTKENDAYVAIREALDATFKPKQISHAAIEELIDEEASPVHVAQIRRIAESFFGNGITPDTVLHDFAHRGGMLWVIKHTIYTQEEERHRVVGYLCLIPLTSEAYQELVCGKLSGADLTTAHVPEKGIVPHAMYIGGVAALDFNSRAVVIHALKAQMDMAKRDGVLRTLTRPVSEDGMRLCHRYRFIPVNGGHGIGNLYEHFSDAAIGR